MSNKPASVRAGRVIDDIRAIAREHGYAIGVHGSMRSQRDIDLIAAPWTKDAHAYSTLVRAVGRIPYLDRPKHDIDTRRPHGRLAALFLIRNRHATCPRWVDLSVMPRGERA